MPSIGSTTQVRPLCRRPGPPPRRGCRRPGGRPRSARRSNASDAVSIAVTMSVGEDLVPRRQRCRPPVAHQVARRAGDPLGQDDQLGTARSGAAVRRRRPAPHRAGGDGRRHPVDTAGGRPVGPRVRAAPGEAGRGPGTERADHRLGRVPTAGQCGALLEQVDQAADELLARPDGRGPGHRQADLGGGRRASVSRSCTTSMWSETKPTGTSDDRADPGGGQRAQVVVDVRLQPGLAGRTRARAVDEVPRVAATGRRPPPGRLTSAAISRCWATYASPPGPEPSAIASGIEWVTKTSRALMPDVVGRQLIEPRRTARVTGPTKPGMVVVRPDPVHLQSAPLAGEGQQGPAQVLAVLPARGVRRVRAGGQDHDPPRSVVVQLAQRVDDVRRPVAVAPDHREVQPAAGQLDP